MAFKQNIAERNVGAQAIADLYAGGIMEIRTGGVAGVANADTGTVLVTINPLPTPAFATASGGACAKSGTWEDTSADATGTAGHFRMRSSSGTYIREGTVGVTGSGADLELSSVSIVAGGDVTITGFSVTQGAS